MINYISGFITRITTELGITVWDGEVPRRNEDAAEIVIDIPADLVFKVALTEAGMTREQNFEDSYTEEGPLIVYVWGCERESLESVLGDIDTLLASDWSLINVGTDNYVVTCMLNNWTCVQEEGIRTRQSTLLYRGELRYNVMAHGNVQTRSF